MNRAELGADLARRHGLPIFRVSKTGKKPAFKGWQAEATNDPDAVAELLEDGHNIGVKTGDGLLVLDFDSEDALLRFEMKHGELPPTLTVRTRKGFHFYFHIDEDCPGPQKWLGLDIDLRCKGNLVIGPGSIIGESTYSVLSDNLIADLPPDIVALLPRAEAIETAEAPILSPNDVAYAAGRVLEYLKEEAPAVEGQGGDAHTVQVAMRCRDLGASEMLAYRLMSVEWNPRCSPPWSEPDLLKKVRSAHRSAQGAIGGALPQAAFEPIPQDPDPLIAGDTVVEWDDAEDFSDEPDPLVDGLINRKEKILVPGASNSGKTAVITRLLVCGARGEVFGNHATCRFDSLVFLGEGKPGAKKRKAAMKKVFGRDKLPIRLVLTNLNLLNKGVARIIRHCENYRDRYDKFPDVVVLDTLASLSPGFKENETDQATLMTEKFEQIIAAVGCTVIAITHYGKDESRGVRGSSALVGNADAVLNVDGKKKTIWASKVREDELPAPMGYSLAKVEVGRYRSGKPITGVVAHLHGRPIKTGRMMEETLRQDQQDLLALVRSLVADPQNSGRGCTLKEITQQALLGDLIEAGDGAVETVRKRLKRIREIGLLTEADGLWRPAETI